MSNESSANILLNAIYNRQRKVILEKCPLGAFEKIFDLAISIDPRIIAFLDLDKITYNYKKNSLISLSEDYEVLLEYSGQFFKIDDIIQYDNSTKIKHIIDTRSHNTICLVGSGFDKLQEELDNAYLSYMTTIEGFDQIYWETLAYKQYSIMNIHVQFICDEIKLNEKHRQTEFDVKKIISEIKLNSRIPMFLKIFMVFSYVCQNCSLNTKAQLEKQEVGQMTAYPNASIAYGALHESVATSKGIAWLLKYFFDALGIENQIVAGGIDDAFLQSDNYYWNLVKIDGLYYHIDATWNINMEGIFVGGYMKSDEEFFKTHKWYDTVPAAKGTRFDYDYVEEYLLENGEELLDTGLPDNILFPEPVNDNN